jgi:hypothetical protein
MQRNRMEGRRDASSDAERDAAQPIGAQPRGDEEEEDALENPRNVPSFLTARELQAREPGNDHERGEGMEGEPATSLDGDRGKRGKSRR